MKKNIVIGFGIFVMMITGCAVGQTNSGVSTQVGDVVSYSPAYVQPQSQSQQGRLIPFTYIGRPNEVHYLDTATVKPVTSYNQQSQQTQNYQYNNGNSNYNANNGGYSNSSYENNNVHQNQNKNVLNNLLNKFAQKQNGSQNNGNYQNSNYQNSSHQNTGISYVAPTTRAPGYGYEWKYNPQTGWNWFNPQYGWY